MKKSRDARVIDGKEMTQSNASSPQRSKVSLESHGEINYRK